MKMLVKPKEFGIFADYSHNAKTNSLYVAKFFEKDHAHVLRDIEQLYCSEDFRQSNFGLTYYHDDQGKKRHCVEMSRDGFWFLAMGYKGQKAATIKETFLKKFNEMEQFIAKLSVVKDDFATLTDGIRTVYGDDAPQYVYSNENNLLNSIITGMSTKKFRELHNIPKGESIRPYLTAKQLAALDKLQKVDTGLLLSTPDYKARKQLLQEYYDRIRSAKAVCA